MTWLAVALFFVVFVASSGLGAIAGGDMTPGVVLAFASVLMLGQVYWVACHKASPVTGGHPSPDDPKGDTP